MHDQSYLALVIFGVLETFLGFDWLMGLDWRWFSSLFGAYNFGVCVQASMAAGIVLVAIFRSARVPHGLNSEHFYLMGKLLFGFTIFWAYFAFGQYLLIWYANIPEETIFYNNHNRGHWIYLSFSIIVGKFMFPAIYLLAQDTKKSLRALTRIAVWILFMHGVELYWFIMPYAHQTILPELAGCRRLRHGRLDPRLRLHPPFRHRLPLPDARPAHRRLPHHHQLTHVRRPHPNSDQAHLAHRDPARPLRFFVVVGFYSVR